MEEKEEKPVDPVKAVELDEEAAAKAFSDDDEAMGAQMAGALDPENAQQSPPDWAVMPEGVKLPPEGTQLAFLRIPAKWTRKPGKGDRTCAVWPIGETEELLAYQRSRGNAVRSLSELAKAAIRVVDGHKADWSADMTKPGSVTVFWSEVGPKGRAMIRNWYIRTHNVTDEEALDFFSQHFVNVTVQRA